MRPNIYRENNKRQTLAVLKRKKGKGKGKINSLAELNIYLKDDK